MLSTISTTLALLSLLVASTLRRVEPPPSPSHLHTCPTIWLKDSTGFSGPPSLQQHVTSDTDELLSRPPCGVRRAQEVEEVSSGNLPRAVRTGRGSWPAHVDSCLALQQPPGGRVLCIRTQRNIMIAYPSRLLPDLQRLNRSRRHSCRSRAKPSCACGSQT